jgi:hypothetical protein
MEVFHLDDLLARLDASQHDFAEFFRARSLSLTIARRPAGAVDDQTPHRGRGLLRRLEAGDAARCR